MNDTMLDRIKTKHSEFWGVVDYVTKKQVIFYDLSREQTPGLRLLVLSWREEEATTRFAVYASTHYPEISLPQPIVIPRSTVKESSKPLISTKVKTSIRKLQ